MPCYDVSRVKCIYMNNTLKFNLHYPFHYLQVQEWHILIIWFFVSKDSYRSQVKRNDWKVASLQFTTLVIN